MGFFFIISFICIHFSSVQEVLLAFTIISFHSSFDFYCAKQLESLATVINHY